ncbi:helix-turn-helix domain-containing protein [Treponema pectinovorum]|uniref:helix-turn-helix domain-containing protein n=1 Tax=Treponema pectinovorum TaxID=164 RepID=UPI0011C98A8F|nr:helix-turn-helix transcriptional regulator [Treponema pectinovorum]
MSQIVQILGMNIRQLRKNYGWTQEFLAEKSNISVPFMTQIELGRKSASLEVIEKIALALGVPYERLFWTEEVKDSNIKSKIFAFENRLCESVRKKIHDEFLELRM